MKTLKQYFECEGGGGTDVTVNVVDAEGIETPIILDSDLTYAEQGYDGYYSQPTYNSNEGESADDFLVDDTYPEDGETIYDYCNDTVPEPEEPEES